MSVEFMVIGMPRSGTAWAANWLTTDTSTCIHDPLWHRHYQDLDTINPMGKKLGIACTGVALFRRFVLTHPARKVIVHRPIDEINASLEKIGMPRCEPWMVDCLEDIPGMHVDWREMFYGGRHKDIYEYLLQSPFDPVRHEILLSLQVETNYEGITVNHEATARLVAELQKAQYCGRLA